MVRGGKMKTTYIQIRISEILKKEFEVVAKANQMTVSEYIRFLMKKETTKE